MSTLTTYTRAALPLIPGASLLPFVAGRGKQMPPLERSLSGVTVDAKQLAEYARVCGFTLRDTLPATYLHIRAFPLHMQLMTDGRFPFPAVGLVHVGNRITVHRPARSSEVFDLHVRVTPIEPHPKGKTFALVSEARVDGDLVWEDVSTMLRRGKGSGERAEREQQPLLAGPRRRVEAAREPRPQVRRRLRRPQPDPHARATRAKLFGFPRAIAHGMWTKARCLAALEPLPDAYTVDVSFRKPILLPGRVTFAHEDGRFAVRSAKTPDTIHLEGTVTP